MIKSMTGFGRAVCRTDKMQYNIEIRSLNSKQSDISVRIPSAFSCLEGEIRNILTQKLERGKISFTVTSSNENEHPAGNINIAQAKYWYSMLVDLHKNLEMESTPDYLSLLIRMPEVISSEVYELSDKDKQNIIDAIQEAIQEADKFRSTEGKALGKDLAARIELMNNILKEIETFEDKRIAKIEERLKKDFSIYNKDLAIDDSRFSQELFYYIERIDITEEKIRLAKHFDHFTDTLNKEEGSGRKLNFIAQEIGREINTIGSKANDYNIQHRVVLMKDELEKIKEQILNIL